MEFKSILRCIGRFLKDYVWDAADSPDDIPKEDWMSVVQVIAAEILDASKQEYDEKDLKLIASFISNIAW